MSSAPSVEGPSGGNVPILRLFDANGTRQLTFYRQNANADRLYVNAGGTTTVTTGRDDRVQGPPPVTTRRYGR